MGGPQSAHDEDLIEAAVLCRANHWQRGRCARCGHYRFRHESHDGMWASLYRSPMDGACGRIDCKCERFAFDRVRG